MINCLKLLSWKIWFHWHQTSTRRIVLIPGDFYPSDLTWVVSRTPATEWKIKGKSCIVKLLKCRATSWSSECCTMLCSLHWHWQCIVFGSLCLTDCHFEFIWPSFASSNILFLMIPSFFDLCFNLCHVPLSLSSGFLVLHPSKLSTERRELLYSGEQTI